MLNENYTSARLIFDGSPANRILKDFSLGVRTTSREDYFSLQLHWLKRHSI